jgi:AIPR protein
LDESAAAALETRDDLLVYGRGNAIALFALQLQYNIEDIEAVAAVAVTDGSNDKKCDLVYVDRVDGQIVIAQGHAAEKHTSKSAPANKASDLNTAVSWLLDGEIESLPTILRSAAIEVRSAFQNGEIRHFNLWYCHNYQESKNVEDELKRAAATAHGLIKRFYPSTSVAVSQKEVGRRRLEELYSQAGNTILVTDQFTIEVDGGFEAQGSEWRAFCTSVAGSWLRRLWRDYETRLTSPNVRDYLGFIRTEQNINNGIKTTAQEEPDRFWIYNNGITALVNDYKIDRTCTPWRLTIDGLGVINGAQTTGSIGTLADDRATSLGDMQVLVRFVRCHNTDVLSEIVRYNNTQNKVEAADFRSKDAIQERLRREFELIPDADYLGGRRGGVRDAIARRRNLVPDRAVAQCLASFHGKPNLAYNETRRIWEENKTYAETFNDQVNARHVVFAYSLMRAVEERKRELAQLADEDRTSQQEKQIEFLRRRGSITILVAAIASAIETILGKPVSNRYKLRFRANCSPAQGLAYWKPVLNSLLPFVSHLMKATDSGLQSQDRVTEATDLFQSMVESTVEHNKAVYESFASTVAST